ncbi:hypothetical protein NS07_v2contig00057-0019 [Nocardia seriolae]|nr:hypothetical protein NSER024013_48930 [Nocardia seriolae]GAM47761.1 hypothetical protein NS07_v2contig00057-0019 [Nocardia seriolae]
MPMSLTATCGEVTVVGMCWEAPDGLWSVVDMWTFGIAANTQLLELTFADMHSTSLRRCATLP